MLWRLEADADAPEALTQAQQGTARLVITLQLVFVFAALLLSVPTRASRRAARAQSRIVGRVPEEPLVLPRHAEDREDEDAVGGVAEATVPTIATGETEDAISDDPLLGVDAPDDEPLPDDDAPAVDESPSDDAPLPDDEPPADDEPSSDDQAPSAGAAEEDNR